MTKKVLTLCFVHTDTDVLLGLKKRGFGMGKWNGFGGKVMPDETIEEAAKRELKEESGLIAQTISNRGLIEFEFDGNPEILEVHMFHVASYEGTPTESEEMKPQWFPKEAIPYSSMWIDDSIWLKHFLAGKRVHGHFLFRGHDTLLSHTLDILDA